MKTLIRKILREQFEYKQQLFDLLRTGDKDNIEMVKMISQGQGIDILELLIEYFKENEPPYFKILNHFDLSKKELRYVLSVVFEQPILLGDILPGAFSKSRDIYDERDNPIYSEDSNGFWGKMEYDENGNLIYSEFSTGYWEIYEYDENGKGIYWENSYGDIKDNR